MKPSPTIPAFDMIKFDERKSLRDMTIPVRVKEKSSDKGYEVHSERLGDAYGSTGHGKVRLFDPTDPQSLAWFINIYNQSQAGLNTRDAFGIVHDGQRYRAKVARRRIGGEYLELRAIPDEVPHVSELLAPAAWGMLAMDSAYLKGGLILITGPQGSGKTTLASAIAASRGLQFDGNILTIENPPEYPLDGWWGKTRCHQSTPQIYRDPVTGREVADFAGALKDTLREFAATPAGGTIIYVGEILDEETAAYTLLAASNKHCVIATSHGETALAAMDRVCQLASATQVIGGITGAWTQLGNNLRLCINQTIDFPEARRKEESYFAQGTYDGEMLWVPGADSAVAGHIRNQNTSAIRDVIAKQTQVARRTKADATLLQVHTELEKIS